MKSLGLKQSNNRQWRSRCRYQFNIRVIGTQRDYMASIWFTREKFVSKIFDIIFDEFLTWVPQLINQSEVILSPCIRVNKGYLTPIYAQLATKIKKVALFWLSSLKCFASMSFSHFQIVNTLSVDTTIKLRWEKRFSPPNLPNISPKFDIFRVID